jgi:hypothetical protein
VLAGRDIGWEDLRLTTGNGPKLFDPAQCRHSRRCPRQWMLCPRSPGPDARRYEARNHAGLRIR